MWFTICITMHNIKTEINSDIKHYKKVKGIIAHMNKHKAIITKVQACS